MLYNIIFKTPKNTDIKLLHRASKKGSGLSKYPHKNEDLSFDVIDRKFEFYLSITDSDSVDIPRIIVETDEFRCRVQFI